MDLARFCWFQGVLRSHWASTMYNANSEQIEVSRRNPTAIVHTYHHEQCEIQWYHCLLSTQQWQWLKRLPCFVNNLDAKSQDRAGHQTGWNKAPWTWGSTLEYSWRMLLKLWHKIGDVVSTPSNIHSCPGVLDYDDLQYLLLLIEKNTDYFIDKLLDLVVTDYFTLVHFFSNPSNVGTYWSHTRSSRILQLKGMSLAGPNMSISCCIILQST